MPRAAAKKTAKKKDSAPENGDNQDSPQENGTEANGSVDEVKAEQNDKNNNSNGKNNNGKSKKSVEESTHAKYERVKKGNLYLADLQKLTVAELHDIAKKEGIKEYTALKKQDLIFRVLKERVQQNGLMYGEGD